jgi:parallel beta-helix repeat protein
MKQIIRTLLIVVRGISRTLRAGMVGGLALLASGAAAAVHHVAAGNAATRDGSPEAPWATLQEALSRSAAGDTVRLRRGDVFREGGLTVTRRTLEAYGDPARPRPRLTGTVAVRDWSASPGRPGVWRAEVSAGRPEQIYADGRRLTLARYPNEGWLFQDNDAGDNILNCAALRQHPSAASGYWVGAQVRWRVWSWWHETRRVTADSGAGRLTVDGRMGFVIRGDRTGCGFYLDGRLAELDAPDEWAWDAPTRTLHLYPRNGATTLAGVEAAVLERGLTLQSGATVRGLRLDGYTEEGVLVTGLATLEDCEVEAIGDIAVRLSWDSSPSLVRGCLIREALNKGIVVNQDPAKAAGTVIERNRLERIGLVPGQSGSSTQQAIGIDVTNGNAVVVQLNRLTDIGYAGINTHSSSRPATPATGFVIRRNVVRRAMATLNDGAGIRVVCDYNTVEENIILDTIGDLASCQPWTPLGHGIWAEFVGNPQPDGTIVPFAGNRIEGNTVYGSGGNGLYHSQNRESTVRGNVFVSNRLGALHLSARTEYSPDCRHEIHDNLFAIGAARWRPFPAESPQRLASWARQADFGLLYEPGEGVTVDYGTLSGNRFVTPSGRALVGRGRNPVQQTLAQWRATEPGWADAGATAVAGRAYLFVNDTEQAVVLPLPREVAWRTLAGADVAGTVALAPFRSAVLLAAGGSEIALAPYVLASEPAEAEGAAPRAVLTNLSVRTALGAGRRLIVGAVARGGEKDVLVRVAGPALAAFGVAGAARPRIELYDAAGDLRGENEAWPASLGVVFERVGSFPFPTGSRDGALYAAMAGGFTAQASAAAAGEVLVEIYDVSGGTRRRLGNLSARGRLETSDAALIAGFMVAGTGPKRLLVRAVGPGLAAFGVAGAIGDPRLEVFDAAARSRAVNDDWASNLRATFAAVGAFALSDGSRDAAQVVELDAPGAYTVHARDGRGQAGELLIEVYELESPP